MTTLEVLKPCPFCGDDGVLDERSSYTVECSVCGSVGWLPGINQDGKPDWNTRPIEDALRTERDELRRMLDAVLALEERVEKALRAESAALRAMYEGELTDEEAEMAHLNNDKSECPSDVREIDSSIRDVRRTVRGKRGK
jgi:hypothetical protein